MISKTMAIAALILISMASVAVAAESQLYVISNMNGTVDAYSIDGIDLNHEVTGSCNGSAVGLAVDSNLGFVFQTSEFSNVVKILNSETLEVEDSNSIPDSINLAGIVADSENSKVYVVRRYTNRLYILVWNPNTEEYEFEIANSPHYIELENLDFDFQDVGAFGIALDEINDRLYVAANSITVTYYDTDDWSHDPDTDYFEVSHNAISIAVDAVNQYVYTGSFEDYGGGNEHDTLSLYDLNHDPKLCPLNQNRNQNRNRSRNQNQNRNRNRNQNRNQNLNQNQNLNRWTRRR